MYRYEKIDQKLVDERVDQFRDQTKRFLAGTLSEDAFRPLRLQNGLYMQKHNHMLRIAIPYGLLSANQLRALANIVRVYDRDYGHFSTRQNIQLNWVQLAQVPDILAELAKVEMHAIQTSGNCVRNITVSPRAGKAQDEVADPRPWAELLRQWSSFHPEFLYLPRKFKIAVSGGQDDDAGTLVHDLGYRAVRDPQGKLGFIVSVGGGLGRTPIIGKVVHEFLAPEDLLSYTEAILRIYNLAGRRDNIYKARIKILVKAKGIEEFRREVEAEWETLRGGPATLTAEEIKRVADQFSPPPYVILPKHDVGFALAKRNDPEFAFWATQNTHAHRVPGYVSVTLTLKTPQLAPGDASSAQMESVAALAERFGFGEVQVTQAQNLMLPDVALGDLYPLWQIIKDASLATPVAGLLGDITSCPGGDYCSLANAVAIPIANDIQARFADLARQAEIGPLKINISGCMNACGHHHIGNIGLLGVDKNGTEFYQITLGGKWGENTTLGTLVGPSIGREQVSFAVERIIEAYRQDRLPNETFNSAVQRLGIARFRAAAYADKNPKELIEEEIANV